MITHLNGRCTASRLPVFAPHSVRVHGVGPPQLLNTALLPVENTEYVRSVQCQIQKLKWSHHGLDGVSAVRIRETPTPYSAR